MNIILGNYGNDSIAVMQWAIDQNLSNLYFVSVDTAWAAPSWLARVEQGTAYAKSKGVIPVRLHSAASFADSVRSRGEFPNKKFQWCPGLLKGLPINDWLDDVDPACEAVLHLGKRRLASRANRRLVATVEASEHYNDRPLCYPIIDLNEFERDDLIRKAGFDVLDHRSLECDPCIHSSWADLKRLDSTQINATAALEKETGKPMFAPDQFQQLKGIRIIADEARKAGKLDETNYNEQFDMGCGSPFACGE